MCFGGLAVEDGVSEGKGWDVLVRAQTLSLDLYTDYYTVQIKLLHAIASILYPK